MQCGLACHILGVQIKYNLQKKFYNCGTKTFNSLFAEVVQYNPKYYCHRMLVIQLLTFSDSFFNDHFHLHFSLLFNFASLSFILFGSMPFGEYTQKFEQQLLKSAYAITVYVQNVCIGLHLQSFFFGNKNKVFILFVLYITRKMFLITKQHSVFDIVAFDQYRSAQKLNNTNFAVILSSP